jgi:hypothetical protein
VTLLSTTALRHALAEGLRLELASEPGRALSESEAVEAMGDLASITVIAEEDQLRELRAVELRVLEGRKSSLIGEIDAYVATRADFTSTEPDRILKARADLAGVRKQIRTLKGA